MNNRIAEIIKRENLTNSQFAQLVGIQPSAVTHLLSGRNEPSLQVTKKILDTFRGINPEWFVMGIGDMYRKAPENAENKTDTKQKQQFYPYQQSLFPDVPIPSQEYAKENELTSNEQINVFDSPAENFQPTYTQQQTTQQPQITRQQNQQPESHDSQNVQARQPYTETSTPYQEKREKPEPTPIAPRIVKKIIVFYSDNTYEEYGAQLNIN